MLQDFCAILKEKIAGIRVFETVAGLVNTIETVSVQPSGTNLVQRFPVSADIIGRDCGDGPIKDLIPDSRKRGIAYFEGSNLQRTPKRFTFGNQWSATIRFVGWLNRDLITGDSNSMINGDIINECMSALAGKFTSPPYKMVTVTFTGITENNPQIFSPYTYDNTDTQYLMAPFTYFALDMAVTFVLPVTACTSSLIYNVKQC